MSNEEREAIDLLKNIDKQKCMMLECPVVKNNIELNRIIRKQFKEIEELKEIYQTGYVNGCVSKVYEINKKWKDKIKAKIEEVQNMKPKVKDIVFKSSLNYIETELKSLLEKG